MKRKTRATETRRKGSAGAKAGTVPHIRVDPADSAVDLGDVFCRLASDGAAELVCASRELPLHDLLRRASRFPWVASIECAGDQTHIRLLKRGKSFSFSEDTLHVDATALFRTGPSSLHLLNLVTPSRVWLDLEVRGGRVLSVAYPGGQFSFDSEAAGGIWRVRTDPAVFLPGGHPITVTTDPANAALSSVQLRASPTTAMDYAMALPHDQFSRFRVAAEAARSMAGDDGEFLDVGAGEGGLAAFLSNVTTLDTQFLDREGHIGRSLFEGDLPACDVALLVDCIEHLDPQRRSAALERLAAVARKGVVVCAPFDTPARRNADAFLTAWLRRVMGREHPHLREHREYGLPELSESRRILEKQGLHCAELEIQPLTIWTVASAMACFLDRDPQFQALKEPFFRFVNQHFPSGVVPPARELERGSQSYETVLLASRSPIPRRAIDSLRARLAALPSGVPPLPAETLPVILDALLQDRLVEKDRQIERLRGEIVEIRPALDHLNERISELSADRDNWRGLHVQAESDRVEKIQHIANLESEMKGLRERLLEVELDQKSRIEIETNLRQQLASVEADRDNWRGLHVQAESDRVEKIRHIANLEPQMKGLRERLLELELDQKSRIEIETKLRQQLASLEEDRNNWRRLCEEAESDRASKLAHITNLEIERERTQSRIAELTTDQQNRIAEEKGIRARLEELGRHSEHLQHELQQKSAQIDTLLSDQQNRMLLEKQLRDLLASVQQDRDNWRDLVKQKSAQIDTLLSDQQNRMLSEKDLRRLLESAEQDRDTQRALVQQGLQSLDALRKHAAGMEAELKRLQSDYEPLLHDRDNWRTLSSRLEAERTTLQEQVGNLERKVAELELDGARRRHTEEALRQQIQELADREATSGRLLRDELAEKGALLKEREERIEEVERRIGGLDLELDRKQRHIDHVESQLREIWSSRTWRALRLADRLLGRGRSEAAPSSQSADLNVEPKPRGRAHSQTAPLRILQAVHFFLPRHYAGSELYTYYLCKELRKRNEVKLLLAEHNLTVPQYTVVDGEYDGIPYREITNNFHYETFENTYDDPRIDAIFEGLVEEFKPDVVHFQHLMNLSAGMIRVAQRHAIPTVFTLHDYWLTCPSGGQRIRQDLAICRELDMEACSECFKRSAFNASRLEKKAFAVAQKFGPAVSTGMYKLLNKARVLAPVSSGVASSLLEAETESLAPRLGPRLDVLRDTLQQVRLFITPSSFARDLFVEFGIPPDKIIHLPNGHAPFEARPHVPADLFRVGFIGTITPHKGVHVLIDACRALPPAQFELRIYGDLTIFPEHAKELRGRAEGLPVRFIGRVENSVVPEIFSELDALVVPSVWWENSPLTVHEAFMARVPVVASAIGGLPELVRPGVNGFLFTPGDAADLAEKLQLLHNNPDLVAHLREGAPRVKTIQENAGELLELYRSLIHKS